MLHIFFEGFPKCSLIADRPTGAFGGTGAEMWLGSILKSFMNRLVLPNKKQRHNLHLYMYTFVSDNDYLLELIFIRNICTSPY